MRYFFLWMGTMNRIISAIREVINVDAVLDSNAIVIEEKEDRNTGCNFFGLDGNSGPHLVIRLDSEKVGRISNYLNPHCKNINRACDGIVFLSYNNKGYIFFVEGKSENTTGAGVQLYNGLLFVNYIDSLLRKYKQVSIDSLEKRFVIFTTNAASKRTTKKRKIKPQPWDDHLHVFLLRCNKVHSLKTLDLDS